MNILRELYKHRKGIEIRIAGWQEELETHKRAFGIVLREEMDKSGISCRALAKELGVSAAYISDVTLGRRTLNTENAEKIVKLLEHTRVEHSPE